MARKLNNAHLRDIADTVDPSGTTGAKMLNNEYLERIANGIGSITGIVDPGTGKIDSSMLEGVIDASNLPSYVDDVIEGYYHQSAFYSDSAHANAITGETGKIYVDVPSGATYRWGGSAYAKVGGPDVEIATTQDAVTGTNDTKVMTPLKTKQAIDASGVPEMSPDVRGGAKLDADGGLALRDGALGVGSLVQESDGTVRGGIASLTAKGHAEQDGTPSPSAPVEIQVVRGRNLLDESASSVGYQVNASGAQIASSGLACSDYISVKPNTAYYMTNGVGAGSTWSMCAYDNAKAFLRTISLSGTGNVSRSFNTGDNTAYIRVNYRNTQNSGYVGPPQLTLGSTPTPYVPYGHVGMAITQNIFDEGAIEWIRGKYINSVGGISDNANLMYSDTFVPIAAGQHELIVTKNSSVSNGVSIAFYDELKAFVSQATVISSTGATGVLQASFTSPATGYLRINVQTTTTDIRVMETATTPIPLPSRGWVGSLPDGTADSLRLDGAGKCEWELGTCENVIDASTSTTSDAIGGQGRATFAVSPNCAKFTGSSTSIDNGVMSDHLRANSNTNTYGGAAGVHRRVSGSTNEIVLGFGVGRFSTLAEAKAWLQSNPVTVLYPLATPVTEVAGYVDMPSIAGDAVISIPELDELGVRYFVDDSVVEYGRQIYERVRNEYADRIERLEQSVAELATT